MQSASHTLIPVNEAKEKNSPQVVNQRTRNYQATHDKTEKTKTKNEKSLHSPFPLLLMAWDWYKN